jgi:hypothetical protein
MSGFIAPSGSARDEGVVGNAVIRDSVLVPIPLCWHLVMGLRVVLSELCAGAREIVIARGRPASLVYCSDDETVRDTQRR